MGMPARRQIWTREEVLALPDDGRRHELVDGELFVSPSLRALHQRAVLVLYDRVKAYTRHHQIGGVMALPGDLDLGSGHLVQPDLFVGAMVDGREPVEWREFGIPLLVVEVLSPATARYDRVTKRLLYQRAGVPAYWIVDLDAQIVEVWTPKADRPLIVDTVLTWCPVKSVPPLELSVEGYFRDVMVPSRR
jgi:Uma2 family endonuclease